MTVISKSQDAPKSQADLLYELQARKERHFRANVGLSWGILLLILVFLFSGQELTIGSQTFSTIKIDTQFILNEIDFIAGGLGQTLLISVLSIMLAIVLALLAALGRLSTIPPIYAVSTFTFRSSAEPPFIYRSSFSFLHCRNWGLFFQASLQVYLRSV